MIFSATELENEFQISLNFDNEPSNFDIEKELKKNGVYYKLGSPIAFMHKDDMWYLGFEDDDTIYFDKKNCYHESWHNDVLELFKVMLK